MAWRIYLLIWLFWPQSVRTTLFLVPDRSNISRGFQYGLGDLPADLAVLTPVSQDNYIPSARSSVRTTIFPVPDRSNISWGFQYGLADLPADLAVLAPVGQDNYIPSPRSLAASSLTKYDYRVAQVRAVFSLTPTTLERVFPDEKPSRYLVYIEWFSKSHSAPQANHGLYRVTRTVERTASIDNALSLWNIGTVFTYIPNLVQWHHANGPVATCSRSAKDLLSMSSW
ncbi:hypothetical protein GGX14DRAFT_397652 [Mycena pura]|uniref:Uncharacterized protein n=1 Tax=Mycena pura TaxID=153505 RepID=A0AAD6VC04_9AGAR|nr:hypothetical protein GGX14DRAFT_397652 [Mycena pura]